LGRRCSSSVRDVQVASSPRTTKRPISGGFVRALCRTRTGDPSLTMAVPAIQREPVYPANTLQRPCIRLPQQAPEPGTFRHPPVPTGYPSDGIPPRARGFGRPLWSEGVIAPDGRSVTRSPCRARTPVVGCNRCRTGGIESAPADARLPGLSSCRFRPSPAPSPGVASAIGDSVESRGISTADDRRVSGGGRRCSMRRRP